MRPMFWLFTLALSGCAASGGHYPDDRPTIGVQQPKPMCSSGPNGKTAACATAVLENAAAQSALK